MRSRGHILANLAALLAISSAVPLLPEQREPVPRDPDPPKPKRPGVDVSKTVFFDPLESANARRKRQYLPHQGTREMARRVRQMERAARKVKR